MVCKFKTVASCTSSFSAISTSGELVTQCVHLFPCWPSSIGGGELSWFYHYDSNLWYDQNKIFVQLIPWTRSALSNVFGSSHENTRHYSITRSVPQVLGYTLYLFILNNYWRISTNPARQVQDMTRTPSSSPLPPYTKFRNDQNWAPHRSKR